MDGTETEKIMSQNKTPIVIGCDHAAVALKDIIKAYLVEKAGIEVKDVGTFTSDSVDYPDFAIQVARAVSEGTYDRGILICGTGIGMSMAANRFPPRPGGIVQRPVRCKALAAAQQCQRAGAGRPRHRGCAGHRNS